MPITLNETVISNCDTSGDWTSDPNTTTSAAGIAAGGVPQREGTGTVEFETSTAGNTDFGVRLAVIAAPTAFSVRSNEVGVWFLNPKSGADGDELIQEIDSALRLRLYSGTNYADYYQKQHRGGDGKFQGGWLYLRASGEAGSEDSNSGTWTNTQADAVDNVAIIVYSQNPNNGKSELEYNIDYVKYYDKIIVTGTNGGSAWTPSDIYDEDQADSGANPEVWGVVNKAENFFKFFCGLEIGDGTTTTEFEAANEFLFFDHSSAAVPYNITIKNNATVTLGVKNAKTEGTYSQDGVQIVATENGFFQLTTPQKVGPSFTVESGGVLKIYAGLLQGFGTVNLGSGGTGIIETLFSDFYDCDFIEFRTTGLTVDNCRYHTESSDKQNLGAVYNAPDSLSNITVFNCLDGFVFRVSYNGTDRVEVLRSLGGTQFDVGVIDPGTLDLGDSIIDPTRIKRVI